MLFGRFPGVVTAYGPGCAAQPGPRGCRSTTSAFAVASKDNGTFRQQSRPAERKTMIDRAHDLPIIRQAEALRVSRSSVYYLPRSVPEADLAIMRRLDRLHLEYPFAGSEAPDFPRQRPAHCPLTLGNVGGSPTPGNHTAETGLAGWGARIRTWEWRNQNPPVSPLISRIILKNRRNSTRFQSIGWTRIQNAPAARRRPCGAS